jgi:hypothetical protein
MRLYETGHERITRSYDPEYCFQNHVDRKENEKVLSKPISDRIAMKEDTEFKIEGLVCS